ncbi:hypothetical protein KC336_g19 [Hortaea werneckii]|nr:hypothetical protein KC336_g19 [Hortaea werneckii]
MGTTYGCVQVVDCLPPTRSKTDRAPTLLCIPPSKITLASFQSHTVPYCVGSRLFGLQSIQTGSLALPCQALGRHGCDTFRQDRRSTACNPVELCNGPDIHLPMQESLLLGRSDSPSHFDRTTSEA